MRFYFVPICGLITLLLHGCASGIASQPSPKPIVPAKPNAVVALGHIQPNGEVIKLSVANAQDSRVDRILIKEGDFVKRSQVIAVLQGIDRKQADQAKLANAEAEYRRRSQFNRSGDNTLGSQAKLTNAQGEYQRKLTLYRSDRCKHKQTKEALVMILRLLLF